MSSNPSESGHSRRQFLRLAGTLAGGAVALPVLAACAPAAPAAPTSAATAARPAPTSAPAAAPTSAQAAATSAAPAAAPTAAAAPKPTAAAAAAKNSVFPSYIPATSGPKPDYPSTGPEYDVGFDNYPKNPVASWTKDPPGTGSTIRMLSIALFPPPTPIDQNPAWQAVNKALNANVQFEVVAPGDYKIRLATAMASSDTPDAMFLYAPTGSSSALAASAGVPQFLEAQCADLTPYLSGDAAKDYPNLAAIPTPAWKNSGAVYKGKLYLIPIHRYLPGQLFQKNGTVWDKVIGAGVEPKDAADFKKILQAMTDQKSEFYGIGTGQGTMMRVREFSQFFGAPNDWRLDSSGKLIKDYESDEHKAATSYVKELFDAGVWHPNSTTWGSAVVARSNFAGGHFAIFNDPFNGWQDSWRQSMQSNSPFPVQFLKPFGAEASIKPAHHITGGHLWATAIKKGSPDRIKEVLRVMDFLASPFGSLEDQMLTFGIEGTDYTRDDNGNPQLTKQGNNDANYVPWKYIVQHPFVFFASDLPNYAKTFTETEHVVMPMAVTDPTFGLASDTAFSKGFTLQQNVQDAINDIVVGHRPFSDYDQIVKDWASGGGDQMRKEYMDAIQAA